MALLNTVTFNVCKDNAKAAAALVKALKAAGHDAELLEVPAEGHAHAKAQGQKSPPAAVAHDAPSDVVVPLMMEVEDDHVPIGPRDQYADDSRDGARPDRGSSPTGPWGGPPPDRT